MRGIRLAGVMVEETISVHFIVRADGLEKDGLNPIVLNKLENDPQVIAGAT